MKVFTRRTFCAVPLWLAPVGLGFATGLFLLFLAFLQGGMSAGVLQESGIVKATVYDALDREVADVQE